MTAIRQIELTQPLAAIDAGAERCMLILRWRGRVVGRTVTPVVGGRLSATALQTVIARSVPFEALSHWLHDELGHDEGRCSEPPSRRPPWRSAPVNAPTSSNAR